MISIKNLKASVDNKEILKGLNLNIGKGEVHAIMGPNGTGKSTLSYVLSGKEGYNVTGEVSFNKKNLLFDRKFTCYISYTYISVHKRIIFHLE